MKIIPLGFVSHTHLVDASIENYSCALCFVYKSISLEAVTVRCNKELKNFNEGCVCSRRRHCGLRSVIQFLSFNSTCLLEFLNMKGVHVLVGFFPLLKLKLLEINVDS